jgi:hypothetical protein
MLNVSHKSVNLRAPIRVEENRLVQAGQDGNHGGKIIW